MRAIKWSRPAQTDLQSIDAFHRVLNLAFAQRVGTEAVTAARFLAAHPNAGAIVPDSSFRKWRVGKTPYLLFYRFDHTTLRVARVVHAARDWRWLL